MRFIILLGMLSSCQLGIFGDDDKKGGQFLHAEANRAYVMSLNPIVRSGNPQLGTDIFWADFLDPQQYFITDKAFLGHDCVYGDADSSAGQFYVEDCFVILGRHGSSFTKKNANGSWNFPAPQVPFLEVQTFHHIKKSVNAFFDDLMQTEKTLEEFKQSGIPFKESIPVDRISSEGLFWLPPAASDGASVLIAYADCMDMGNAYFAPATRELCFGKDSNIPNFAFPQDPSVIYHEMGHVFTYILMNLNNHQIPMSSSLGNSSYDEAGAINEGLADYFSYMMTNRTHVGEWALGRFYQASRPLSEEDGLHTDEVKRSGSLRYPEFVSYNPNQLEVKRESIHEGGKITSHFLVDFTKKVANQCFDAQIEPAKDIVFLNLALTLAELGDLSKSEDGLSNEWLQSQNPVNYRRFFQTFAKHALSTLSFGICAAFDQDTLEMAFDQYGLLLFKTYNDDNDSTNGDSVSGPLTGIREENRRQSKLVNKSSLQYLQNAGDEPQIFLIDKKDSIEGHLRGLSSIGRPLDLSPELASPKYNNNRRDFSAGEIVGVSFNLFNNHPSIPIAGIQVLAGPWDHFGTIDNQHRPCPINYRPEQGDGITPGSDSGCSEIDLPSLTQGNLAPACYVNHYDQETRESTWISQHDYRLHHLGLAPTAEDCLASHPFTDRSKQSECFLRIIPGADVANYAKIGPEQSWREGLSSPDGEKTPLHSGNLILMEINKNTPPGTRFQCRFRARFTNCDNCYHDRNNSNDDFTDNYYISEKPFQLIEFEFVVR